MEQHEFFLSTLPGLEDLAERELRAWAPTLTATPMHGGLKVQAPLNVGLALNRALKIPTRILLRVDQARVRDFPKLYQRVRGLDWERWLKPGCALTVSAATRLSRLKIKRRIEETCLEAWTDRLLEKGITINRSHKVNLFARFVEDECTLSLDTSGERLHKRGERVHIGEAPLRETIAAAMLQMLEEAAPGGAPVEIVDPMMGSGVFLAEAAGRDAVVDRREFAFQGFALAEVPALPPPVPRTPIAGLVGFEKDAATLTAARHNLRHTRARLIEADIFTAPPLEGERRRWALVNPPYGERLAVKEPLGGYYEKLFAAIARVVRPELSAVLLPSRAVKGKFVLPPGWKVRAKRSFLNGGIPVTAFVFEAPAG